MDLIAANSEKAPVVEEAITENVVTEVEETVAEVAKTPSLIDRSVEPTQGPSPSLNVPQSWSADLGNGMKVYGIEQDEIPTVNFNLVIEGGHLLDDKSKNGVANMMTDIMITRNFDETLALVKEILLEPRWDEEEFARIKTATVNGIKRSAANPNAVANRVYNKLLYGEDHIFSYPTSGTEESVNAITIDDMKAFYEKNFSPSISRFHIVGKIDQATALNSLKDLESAWAAKEVTIPTYEVSNDRDKSSLYFVDIPNAKQSVLNVGYIGMKRTDDDYYAATVMNHKLGGSFNSDINMTLREEKGYTYGARSGFSGTKIPGTFTASSSVRTNTTGESVEIIRDLITDYKNGIPQEDLDFSKNALIKSNARRFETQFALLGMIQTMSAYNLSSSYIADEEAIVRSMTLERHKELANKYLDESKMAYLVVGDAATQYAQFATMGFDEVKLVDKEGKEVDLKEVKQ